MTKLNRTDKKNLKQIKDNENTLFDGRSLLSLRRLNEAGHIVIKQKMLMLYKKDDTAYIGISIDSITIYYKAEMNAKENNSSFLSEKNLKKAKNSKRKTLQFVTNHLNECQALNDQIKCL